MKKIALAMLFTALAMPVAVAMPIAPVQNIQSDDGEVIMVRKGGGSSRSAKSGRFVSRGYAKGNKSSTVTHGKY